MNASNPYAPPRAAVDDVQGSSEVVELAGRGARLGAAVVDILIGMAIMYGPLIVSGDLMRLMRVLRGESVATADLFNPTTWMIILVLLLVWAAVAIVLVHRNGQSVGKKLLGIKVVRSDGSRASLGRIFWLRNFVNSLIGMVAGWVLVIVLLPSPLGSTLYALVDHLFIFGEKRQCLHDRIADTIVIKA
jgi:uncharacterized RDD family membrane protein YckC